MSQNLTIQHSFVAARRALRSSSLACLLSATLWSAGAQAQEETRSADVAAARDLAIEGLKLADAGQCSQAIDKLSRAEKLHHAPIVLGRLGECEIAEGKIVDGTENLRRLLREALPNNPPAALLKARERAQTALDAAKPKIAFLSISVKDPGSEVTVTVDGQVVPAVLFDRSRPTDPGEHVVEASAPGFLKATRQVTLGPGEKQDMAFRLVPDPQAAIAAKDAQAPNAPANDRAQPQGTSHTSNAVNVSQAAPASSPASPNYAPSYVLWSVGAVAAGVGGVFGYVALKDKRDLDKICPDGSCGPAAQGQLDSARREALASTILVGAGGVALAVGTVLYLLTGPSAETPPTTASLRAKPRLGLGQLGIEGTF